MLAFFLGTVMCGFYIYLIQFHNLIQRYLTFSKLLQPNVCLHHEQNNALNNILCFHGKCFSKYSSYNSLAIFPNIINLDFGVTFTKLSSLIKVSICVLILMFPCLILFNKSIECTSTDFIKSVI